MAGLSFHPAAKAARLRGKRREIPKSCMAESTICKLFCAAARGCSVVSQRRAFIRRIDFAGIVAVREGGRVTAEGRAGRLYAQAHGAAKRLRPKGDDPSRSIMWPQTRPVCLGASPSARIKNKIRTFAA
jgi:hypothetical protein